MGVGQWRTTFLKARARGDHCPHPARRGVPSDVTHRGGTAVNAARRTVRLVALFDSPRGSTAVNAAGCPVQDLDPYIYAPPKPRLAGFPFSLVYEATDLPPASAGGPQGQP
jgi:hypothetical protein